ncbi:hypothetical protein [Pseudarthrobacter sp. PS3-L1]|uniref:hypothetical protein n=1 Tax=Pseudarthrobacter sp. PS3-L1 TaxID=3046207 RepID=UPI0024B9C4BD|nr:hypothetical protein [Pseudarthrobacter sp. PS3-L1]MDJ0321488.1 hypothetical protein [Pseudarthrobacter sp. PS3-L1]
MSQKATIGSARLKRPSWRDPRLVVGILLVLVSVAGVILLLRSADQTTEVFAAGGSIAVGQKLTVENLIVVNVKLGAVETHYFTVEGGVPENLVAIQRIAKNELIPRESLGRLDSLNRKPVSIDVADALPDQAVPGARVDVWVALPDDRNGFSEPELLLPSAEIAAITQGTSSLGAQRTVQVMILVPDEKMPALLGAQANKANIAVVWNPGAAQ